VGVGGMSMVGWPRRGSAAHKHTKTGCTGAPVFMVQDATAAVHGALVAPRRQPASKEQEETRQQRGGGAPPCRGDHLPHAAGESPKWATRSPRWPTHARARDARGCRKRQHASTRATRADVDGPGTGQAGPSSKPPSRLPHRGEGAGVAGRTRNRGPSVGMPTRGTGAPTTQP